MNITDVRISLNTNENKPEVLASASFTIDDAFVVHRVLIVAKEDGSIHVSMPQNKMKDGTFKDICHPINRDARRYVSQVIIDAYKEAAGV